jgi:hypothetical protein
MIHALPQKGETQPPAQHSGTAAEPEPSSRSTPEATAKNAAEWLLPSVFRLHLPGGFCQVERPRTFSTRRHTGRASGSTETAAQPAVAGHGTRRRRAGHVTENQ